MSSDIWYYQCLAQVALLQKSRHFSPNFDLDSNSFIGSAHLGLEVANSQTDIGVSCAVERGTLKDDEIITQTERILNDTNSQLLEIIYLFYDRYN